MPAMAMARHTSITRRTFRRLLIAALCLAGISAECGTVRAQSSRPATLLTVDGRRSVARVERIESDWNVVFRADDGSRSLSPEQYVHWGRRVEPGKGPQIQLADGGMLIADVLALNAETVTIGIDFDAFGDATLWQRIEVPLTRVRGIIFQPPSDVLSRDRLAHEIMSAEGNQDRLILSGGDRVSGVLTGPAEDADSSDQVIRLIPADRSRQVAVPLDKVAALIVNPTLVQRVDRREPFVLMGFREGSCVRAEQIRTVDGMTLLKLAAGIELSVETETMLSELALLRPFGRGVTYLTELTSGAYRHYPYLDLTWPLAEDRNVLGGRLRHDDSVHTKGLGMHSKSRLAYRLDGKYKTFHAELAIDRAAGRQGSVTFQVYLSDTSGNWRPAYESPIVRGGDEPVPISVDVSQARAMLLVVDFADHGDQWDHACWLSPLLIAR